MLRPGCRPTIGAVTPERLLARRLARQLLAPPGAGGAAAGDPAAVVAHFGAVQAQEYGQALWAVGLRCAGATAAGIEAAIDRGDILRTWPMRGTIHLVPAAGRPLDAGAAGRAAHQVDGRRLREDRPDARGAAPGRRGRHRRPERRAAPAPPRAVRPADRGRPGLLGLAARLPRRPHPRLPVDDRPDLLRPAGGRAADVRPARRVGAEAPPAGRPARRAGHPLLHQPRPGHRAGLRLVVGPDPDRDPRRDRAGRPRSPPRTTTATRRGRGRGRAAVLGGCAPGRRGAAGRRVAAPRLRRVHRRLPGPLRPARRPRACPPATCSTRSCCSTAGPPACGSGRSPAAACRSSSPRSSRWPAGTATASTAPRERYAEFLGLPAEITLGAAAGIRRQRRD